MIYLFFLSNSYSQDTSKKVDSLKLILFNKIPDITRIHTLHELSEVYFLEKIDSSQFYADSLLRFSSRLKSDIGKIKALFILSKIHKVHEKYDEAISKDSLALTIATKTKDEKNELCALIGIGESYQAKKNYEKAITYYKKVVTLGKIIKDTNSIAIASLNLSNIYYTLYEYDKAIQLLFPFTLYNQNRDLPEILKEDIFSSLGDIYSRIQKNEKALENYNEAYRVNLKTKNNNKQLDNLEKIGILYRVLKQHDKSIASFLEALKISEREDIDTYKSKIFRGLGYTYYFMKDYENAADYFFKNLEWSKEKKNNYDIARAYMSLGQVYFDANKLNKAYPLFDNASKLFLIEKEVEVDLERLKTIYLSLYVIEVMKNNYNRTTLQYYKKYITLRDSVSAKNQREKIAAIEIDYQTEKKDEEIKLLIAENELQKIKAIQQHNLKIGFIIGSGALFLFLIVLYNRYRLKKKAVATIRTQNNTLEVQKEAIEEKNKENELLIKEIHHRVKNNLQIILSLLNAQMHSAKGDQKIIDVIIESQNKIRSMALIHKNLYNEDSLVKVAATNYFKDLIAYIKNSYKDTNRTIKFITNIEESEVKMTLALSLGLIVNELITNSYKYAFNNPNQENIIIINFNKAIEKDIYRLEVFDNGKGLPEGFNLESSRTFGIQMIKGLVEQFNGKMEFRKEKGTRFYIHIKDVDTA